MRLTTRYLGVRFPHPLPEDVLDLMVTWPRSARGDLPSIRVAQFINETDWGRSFLFHNGRNLFGIKPSVGGRYQSGELRGHATYRSHEDCMRDRDRILEWYATRHPRMPVMAQLDTWWAPRQDYGDKLDALIRQYNLRALDSQWIDRPIPRPQPEQPTPTDRDMYDYRESLGVVTQDEEKEGMREFIVALLARVVEGLAGQVWRALKRKVLIEIAKAERELKGVDSELKRKAVADRVYPYLMPWIKRIPDVPLLDEEKYARYLIDAGIDSFVAAVNDALGPDWVKAAEDAGKPLDEFLADAV